MAIVNHSHRRVAFALPPLLAWLLIWAAKWLPWMAPSGEPRRYLPALPLVCVPYRYGSDVVSLVPDLFQALTIALLGAVLVEFTKAAATSVSVYAAASVYQATLALDAMRRLAPDWYGYSLYFAHLVELRDDVPRPEVLPVPSPYLSLVALLLLLAYRQWVEKGKRADAAA
jgi:hypothetical protein